MNVCMVFTIRRRGKIDLANLQNGCLDLLVKHNVLADDNSKIVASHDGSRVEWVERPEDEGVRVTITEG